MIDNRDKKLEAYRLTLATNAKGYAKFDQNKLWKESGICLTFCCRWAIAVAESTRNYLGGISTPPMVRMQQLAGDKDTCVEIHQRYGEELDKHQSRLKRESEQVDLGRMELPDMKEVMKMSEEEQLKLVQRLKEQQVQLQEKMDDLGGFVRFSDTTWINQAEDGVADALGVRLSPEITMHPFKVEDFAERAECMDAFIWWHIEKNHTYLLLMQGKQQRSTGHAIAIHRTTGMMWQDWYIFDPNLGEYKYDSRSVAGAVLASLFTTYKHETVRVIDVTRREILEV